jgi:hypothetical protein
MHIVRPQSTLTGIGTIRQFQALFETKSKHPSSTWQKKTVPVTDAGGI